METDLLTAAAAFLSGIGSVLTGWLALRYERKRSAEECARRIEALHEGMVLRDRVDSGRPLTDEEKTR